MRAIDADTLIKKMLADADTYSNDDIRHGYHNCVSLVYDAHTIELKQETGEWIDTGDPATWVCECCGYRVFRYNNTPFCPNCGAKME